MKHDPKMMKAKADKMHKSGAISEKERDRLHKKADVEIAKAKATPKVEAPAVDGDADDTQTPAKRKAATKAPVMRGQPLDEEERDQ